MRFLPPNQQRQSTEGTDRETTIHAYPVSRPHFKKNLQINSRKYGERASVLQILCNNTRQKGP